MNSSEGVTGRVAFHLPTLGQESRLFFNWRVGSRLLRFKVYQRVRQSRCQSEDFWNMCNVYAMKSLEGLWERTPGPDTSLASLQRHDTSMIYCEKRFFTYVAKSDDYFFVQPRHCMCLLFRESLTWQFDVCISVATFSNGLRSDMVISAASCHVSKFIWRKVSRWL